MKFEIRFALVFAVLSLAFASHAQGTERRLEPYRCALRLPDADFTWLAEDDVPGATLACRDSNDRFVILKVWEAPPNYHLDARQAAGFEQGMSNKSDGIERLGGNFLEFLGVPCYEMRGRIKANQSLTLTRMFVANGFLYNFQAMIPAPTGTNVANFDKLMAAFQFIGAPVVPQPLVTSGPTVPAGIPQGTNEFPVSTTPAADRGQLAGTAPTVGFVPEPLSGAVALAVPSKGPTNEADSEPDAAYRMGQLAGVSLLAAAFLALLLRLRDNRRQKR